MTEEQNKDDAELDALLEQEVPTDATPCVRLNRYKVSVCVLAKDKQTAFDSMGLMLRTDTTMNTINDDPFNLVGRGGVYVDWESLHAEEAQEGGEA